MSDDRFIDRYRPQRLADVVGQQKVTAHLSGLLSQGKIAGNTLLFSGPYGTGKTTLGRIVARALNCSGEREPGDVEPCGSCPSCRFNIDNHPDIKEINAAESRGIEEVRALLDVSKLKPRHKVRVFILDECHQLTGPAAQAFLKKLEEPPKQTAFILCTTEPYKLLATIRSRAQWSKLSEITPRDTTRLLTRICKAEGLDFPKEVLEYISTMAAGHGRDAVNMLESLASSTKSMNLSEAKERLPELAQEILGASPDALVPKYVQKLLSGTIVPMVYLRKVENPEYFLTLVLKFLKEMTIFTIEPKMVDNPALASFMATPGLVKASADQLTNLFELHLDAQDRVKTRSVDPLDAIDLAILKSVKSLKRA